MEPETPSILIHTEVKKVKSTLQVVNDGRQHDFCT